MVFVPLGDRNPRIWVRYHYVTLSLIAASILIFIWHFSGGEAAANTIAYGLGVIPASLWGAAELPPNLYVMPAPLTLLTSMFLHGGVLHLLGNMLFLWVFGDNVEDAMGHRRFVAFYLMCGVAGGLLHAAINPGSTVPVIGASGAISGVLGAYLVLHPKVKVWVLILVAIPVRLPTYVVLGVWIGLDVINGLFLQAGTVSVAFWAHIGGFAAGAGLIRFFKYDHVPLFDKSEDGHPNLSGLTLPSWRRGPWGGK